MVQASSRPDPYLPWLWPNTTAHVRRLSYRIRRLRRTISGSHKSDLGHQDSNVINVVPPSRCISGNGVWSEVNLATRGPTRILSRSHPNSRRCFTRRSILPRIRKTEDLAQAIQKERSVIQHRHITHIFHVKSLRRFNHLPAPTRPRPYANIRSKCPDPGPRSRRVGRDQERLDQ